MPPAPPPPGDTQGSTPTHPSPGPARPCPPFSLPGARLHSQDRQDGSPHPRRPPGFCESRVRAQAAHAGWGTQPHAAPPARPRYSAPRRAPDSLEEQMGTAGPLRQCGLI